MDIFNSNLWVGVGRHSKLNRILFLSSNKEIKNYLKTIIQKQYDRFYQEKDSIKIWNREAIVLEEKYYYDVDKISEKDVLQHVKENVLGKDALSSTNEPIIFRKYNKPDIDKNDVLKFLLIETKEEILFLNINSRSMIRKANFIDLFNGNFEQVKGNSIGIDTKLIEVNNGIQVPENITAIYQKYETRLYVLNVLDFEKMLYINEKNREIAKDKFDKFRNGEYTVGAEGWKVEFEDKVEIKNKIFKSNRSINRLANYQNNSVYEIDKIKSAVNQLNEKSQKVIFHEEGKIVKVNKNNYKTFIGIIHNGIVKRLISGDVEVVN